MGKKKAASTAAKPALPSLIDYTTKELKKTTMKDVIQTLDKVEPHHVIGCPIPALSFEKLLESTKGKVPYGSIGEIYGPESSGKTTLTWEIIAYELGMINLASVALFVDMEQAGFGFKLADELNVDRKRCLFAQPRHGEQALAAVQESLQTHIAWRQLPEVKAISEEKKPHLVIVVDSVSALVPKAALNASIDDPKGQRKAAIAALMSDSLARLTPLVNEAQAILIFINQTRTAFEMKTQRSWIETSGGVALKFYSSWRFSLFKKAMLKLGETYVGLETHITVNKNKFGVPWRRATLIFGWGNGPYDLGLDSFNDLFNWAKAVALSVAYPKMELAEEKQKFKVINLVKGNSWSTLTRKDGTEVKFQGLIGFKKKLVADKGIMLELITCLKLKEYRQLLELKYSSLLKRSDTMLTFEQNNIIAEIEDAPKESDKKEAEDTLLSDGDYKSDTTGDAQMDADLADLKKSGTVKK